VPSKDDFRFQFSLEVLNHLGRGLYRSFATVVAEAVSNAWDAEAREVNITISANSLTVEDNGKGMDANDFQGKFLNVGFSRRGDKTYRSSRIVIGR
jgi:DNA gyrase/topoisomerase IV subunit B